MTVRSGKGPRLWAGLWAVVLASSPGWAAGEDLPKSNRTVEAQVVALDQPFLWNRLGTSQPGGMIFALKQDVVSRDQGAGLGAGRVMLRPGKRPRPLVLRLNSGDKLRVEFTNLLAPTPVNASAATRYVGFQVNGLDLAMSGSLVGDGAWVGKNPSGLAAPGETKVYEYFAKAEGAFLVCNGADEAAGGGSAGLGLFGAVNVQPEWAEWYRSQVTRDDLIEATMRPPAQKEADIDEAEMVTPRLMRLLRRYLPDRSVRKQYVRGQDRELFTLETTIPGKNARSTRSDVVIIDGRLYTVLDQPIIDYNAVYGPGPRQGQPILRMVATIKGAALFTTDPATFPPAKVREAAEAFNHNTPYVSADLKEVFRVQGQELTDRVRITDEQGRAWLLTDPANKVYLVEEIGPPAGTALRVSSATIRIAHSDLTAIITGARADRFGFDQNSPSFYINPTYPDRRQPYREFTIMYHQAPQATQAFANYFNPNTKIALGAGADGFAINYGMAGIGSEILASRLGVGPMGNPDNVDLKYEEFFLSSWAVGDPAMVVDVPANARNQAVTSPSASNPTAGLQVTQQLLFTIDEVEATDGDMAALNAGRIPQKLVDKFKEKGIAINKAFSSAITFNGQWVILDPYDLNAKPDPDRARYPILRTADTPEHGGKVTTTLSVYSGFPIAPGLATTFNATKAGELSGTGRVKATKAFYPDDPSNVYHSNIRDHVKFRILHAGPGPSHVHHLHAHQWLHSPDSPQAQYLDSQLIIPGATYTLEMVYNGTGNRNLTVGDSIFHCHFYPHFAQGMWSLWRSHDVLETGTWLDPEGRPVTLATTVGGKEVPVSIAEGDGKTIFYYLDESKARHEVEPASVTRAWNRALPDGEIEAGTPIPAIVPLPSIAMPLPPAKVRLTDLKPLLKGADDGQGRRVEVEMKNAGVVAAALAEAKKDPKVTVPEPEYDNPGYPFFVPGIAGHRPPHPPLDFAWKEDASGKPVVDADSKRIPLDGGLPRHVVLGGKVVKEYHTRWDFSRDFIEYDRAGKSTGGELDALQLPEEGTPYERAAMKHHSERTHASYLPNGDPGNITRNGLKSRPGAPYAPPEVDDYGNANFNARRYQAAVIQTDVVLNKLGWHYPQQRFLSLWEDVSSVFGGTRPPQPLFFRADTNDTIEFWHTNLVPSYYELDDFQVRTPTDVIGQHIHNVKFDVTSSDGGSNGFNYEDGTFSPGEVRDRVNAIDRAPNPVGQGKGLLQFDKYTSFVDPAAEPKQLEVVRVKDAYPPRGGAGDNEHGLFGKPPLGQDWDGAQTTIQRWDSDPLLDNYGEERTLRTIFTHDHLGPSTHQQVGLYAGLVTEPQGSLWYLASGERMNQRHDGGPTSWEGYIVTPDPDKSYREFAIEFQDTQLAYGNASRVAVDNSSFDPAKTPKAAALFEVGQYPGAKPEVPAFIRLLNKEILPPAFVNTIFPAMGVPLSGKEKVKVNKKDEAWLISVPQDSPPNAGASYPLRASKDGLSLVVYTPGIAPGWSDPPNALNPPGDPTNASNGGPFPQLISTGMKGTYSMNYRNEPAIARLTPKAAGAAAPAVVAGPHPMAPATPPAPAPAPAQSGPAAPEQVAPAAPAAQATIEVDGQILNGVPTWTVNNGPAANVPIKPGDTIAWKAVSGTHGVVFDTQAEAEAVLQFSTGGTLPALGPQTVKGEPAWGTAPQPAGTLLAQATVKATVTPGTTLGFFCSQHGRAMSGSLASGAAPPKTVEVDGQFVGGRPAWTVGSLPANGVSVNPGDTLVWKALTGTHGVVFDTQALAQGSLQFETGGKLPALGIQTVGAEKVWGTAPQPAGTVLAQATVKADVAPGTLICFFCSQHGRAMSGNLIVAGLLPSEATDPASVFKSIPRNAAALNVQPVPGTPINPFAAKSVEVDGQILDGVPTWTVGSGPAVGVAVNPGDTLTWKAVSGTHGVVFDTQALAEGVLQFQSGGTLPPLGPRRVDGQLVWGTAPQPAGTILAQATVKAGIKPGTTLGFFCSQHGRAMSGSIAANWFVFPPYVVNPSTATDKGGVEPTDPFTPLLRAYANDDVQVRVLVGAHTLGHSFQIQGLRWAFEPTYLNSGYKNAQAMGISEHFEMIFKVPPVGADHKNPALLSFADYLVSPSSSVEGLAQGNWTMLRAFTEKVGQPPTEKVGQSPPGKKPSPNYLAPLPNNPLDKLAGRKKALEDKYAQVRGDFAAGKATTGTTPGTTARLARFNITATTAFKALGGKPLSFNPRVSPSEYDRFDALMFVRDEDLQGGVLKPGAAREPLILRVGAGDWVEINLTNALTDDPAAPGLPCPQNLSATTPFAPNGNGAPNIASATNNLVPATRQVGLHPALVSYDVTQANGVNIGFNPDATVAPGSSPTKRTFYWYAGDLAFIGDELHPTPTEYGAINLAPADLLVQGQFGMVGALVVEPSASTWVEDKGTRASATVTLKDGNTFRDFVLVGQNRVANAVDGAKNPWGAFNYRTETFAARHVNLAGTTALASDSQWAAIKVLTFETDRAKVAPLGPVGVLTPSGPNPGLNAVTAFGTHPKTASTPPDPVVVLAQAVVKDVPAGTKLDFFCTQHGRPMSGSLIVEAAGAAKDTVVIDGTLVNNVPTWVAGNNQPAVDVKVKPGDTVIWRVLEKTHGVVFEPTTGGLGYGLAFSNDQLLPSKDPETPIFRAAAGTPARFRLVMPSTSTVTVAPMVFDIHGHGWPEEPSSDDGTVIGGWPEFPFAVGIKRPPMNWRSQYFGSQQVAVYEAFNFVIDHAGGRSGVLGDYLYEGFQTSSTLGMWGLFRVEKDLLTVNEVVIDGPMLTIKGGHEASRANRGKPVSFTVGPETSPAATASASGDGSRWSFVLPHQGDRDVTYTVRSSLGGEARIKVPGTVKPSPVAGEMPAHGRGVGDEK